ncbi:ligase [Longispora fulva]|uniref:Lipid II isoglutaminyl synthase (glutamine-hydrolyzing) subunit MurT n=1 Tax=Longispora fulva TaxID=619741 RepID=A0A8J7GIB4_9ACTN|nr:MurT ligase domain-containing protein [Longispora fulva]MBG6141183.1 UDP-N-acetylmuramyl tripeptide synthase [Longispora fulva]GIG62821.1 ligase [Longispora fulva]
MNTEPVPLPLRAKLATTLLKSAAALSRATGRGDGSVIGGRVGLKVEPQLLAMLARGKEVALVSGTNGKTTTTRFIAAALGALGEVATNSFGANMPTGHTTALAQSTGAPYAVLEVDEHYLRGVLPQTTPRVVALLNLSRDQLDRAMEVGMMAEAWRKALDGVSTHIVANCDDPMIVWAASTSREVTWVAAGQRWQEDSFVCPNCGRHLDRDGVHWACPGCQLRRPTPTWSLDDTDAVLAPDGNRYEVTLQLPGRVNKANAATALAVAARFGVSPAQALPRIAQVASIAGRYATVVKGEHVIRLLLAKNPAGWLEALDMVEPGCPVLLAINARDPDGLDTSWLYDVDFSPLRGRRVLVAGDRAYDLCVRLDINEVPFEHVPNFGTALDRTGNGRLEVIANYTAFQDIRAELDRVN